MKQQQENVDRTEPAIMRTAGSVSPWAETLGQRTYTGDTETMDAYLR